AIFTLSLHDALPISQSKFYPIFPKRLFCRSVHPAKALLCAFKNDGFVVFVLFLDILVAFSRVFIISRNYRMGLGYGVRCTCVALQCIKKIIVKFGTAV